MVQCDDTSRRDRKKRATRDALRIAALKLVAERGLAHVTVEDISDAVDVSSRTFFNYFPSKEAAVIGHDPEHIELLRHIIADAPASESIEDCLLLVVRESCDRVLDVAEEGGSSLEWLQRMQAVRSDPHLRAAMGASVEMAESVLVTAIAERIGVDPEVDAYPALLAVATMSAVRVAMMWWARAGGLGSPTPLGVEAFKGLTKGLDRAGLHQHLPDNDKLLRGPCGLVKGDAR